MCHFSFLRTFLLNLQLHCTCILIATPTLISHHCIIIHAIVNQFAERLPSNHQIRGHVHTERHVLQLYMTIFTFHSPDGLPISNRIFCFNLMYVKKINFKPKVCELYDISPKLSEQYLGGSGDHRKSTGVYGMLYWK